MKVISAFAGIGGFDRAATQAGHHVVAHIERDAQCRKLLAAKFPQAVALDDVCTAGAHNLPPCDVLCGGWPCQDLSVAGLRAGLVNGSRSNLFYELTRLIRELRPRYFVGENVPGLLSSDGGGDFARVLGELGNCGARDIAWATLDAQWFGVAQRRRRVFLVADFGGERAGEILSLDESLRGNPAPCREAGKDVAGTLGGSSQSGGFRTTDLDNNGAFICRDVAPTLDCSFAQKWGLDNQHVDAGCGHYVTACFDERQVTSKTNRSQCLPDVAGTQHATPHAIAYRTAGNCGPFEQGDKTAALNTATDPNQNIIATRSAVRRLTPCECERLQGFPDDWTAGFADSTRYKMLGNAVAVPVVRWILERL